MNYQWYPGHMTKARRMMQDNLKLIDLIIELIDARVPYSSKNPDIDTLANGKYRMLIINKADLSDKNINRKWVKYYEDRGFFVLEINSRQVQDLKQILPSVQKVCEEKILRDRKKGIINRPVRCMIAGIPNVGKSTFINSLVRRSAAKTGNKPGVTKGKQWIKLVSNLELLDTPGILWPRFEDQTVGEHIAMIGSMNDEIINPDELAYSLINCIRTAYPEALEERYKVSVSDDSLAILNDIAIERKCFLKGEEPDLRKASMLLLEDFRSGRLGKISIERPESYEK